MENFTPPQENNPAARLMSVAEMVQFADVLMLLQGFGKGDETINALCKEIQLQLGKRSEAEVSQLLEGKEK